MMKYAGALLHVTVMVLFSAPRVEASNTDFFCSTLHRTGSRLACKESDYKLCKACWELKRTGRLELSTYKYTEPGPKLNECIGIDGECKENFMKSAEKDGLCKACYDAKQKQSMGNTGSANSSAATAPHSSSPSIGRTSSNSNVSGSAKPEVHDTATRLSIATVQASSLPQMQPKQSKAEKQSSRPQENSAVSLSGPGRKRSNTPTAPEEFNMPKLGKYHGKTGVGEKKTKVVYAC